MYCCYYMSPLWIGTHCLWSIGPNARETFFLSMSVKATQKNTVESFLLVLLPFVSPMWFIVFMLFADQTDKGNIAKCSQLIFQYSEVLVKSAKARHRVSLGLKRHDWWMTPMNSASRSQVPQRGNWMYISTAWKSCERCSPKRTTSSTTRCKRRRTSRISSTFWSIMTNWYPASWNGVTRTWA